MELLSINVLFVPTAADSDTDDSLLLEDWEKFFWQHGCYQRPRQTRLGATATFNSTLLVTIHGQITLNIPAVPIATFAPGKMTIIELPSGNYALRGGDTYVSSFEFNVKDTATLMNLQFLITGIPVSVIVYTYQIDLGSAASFLPANFFRMFMSLPQVRNESTSRFSE